MAASCGASKKTPSTITSQNGIPQPSISSVSSVYVGEVEYGFGISYNKGEAYTIAIENAQENMALRLYRSLSSVDEPFNQETQSGTNLKSISNRTRKMIGIVDNKVVSISLMKDAEFARNPQGYWECTVQVFLDKKVVKDAAKTVYDSLSEDDELRVKFEEKQFEEEFEKRLKEYRESHK